jgi:Raf kinase inhibitor-like YbhB/YbcL family protein
MTLELFSPAFSMGAAIPARHTAGGVDLSPPLQWTGVPRAARAVALLVEDPEAPEGSRVNWLAWNLPAHLGGLAEAVAPEDPRLRQGLNDFGRCGWAGPHPPCRKGARRYLFRLFALDAFLDLPAGAGRPALEAAMHGHVLAEARLMGKHHRRVCACASSGAGCSRDSGSGRH